MSAQRPQAGPSNRLISEKSPYLLQHAYNPVDWFPWGQEAFQKARVENKPIFLSIGYSTCHWCHVMERESFESPEIAKILNEFFVPIKVDREERPDIDQIYMSAIQMMTGSGGWPLSVFMTPEGKPFSGGTYFPPEDRWGRAGMKTLLPRLAEVWKTKREEIEKAGEEIAGHLNTKASKDNTQLIDEKVFAQAVKQFEAHFDPQDGGFGQAPKFPRSHELSFLLRYWKKTNHAGSLAIVEKTLQAMAFGGMYDHLGGGFHRYSTDAKWLVPHFEKMLYDQAILAQTYSEAYLATKNPFYAAVAKDIFNYILRDMTGASGGFYSAEDADSEGEEGKFYVWTPEEIEKVLGAEDARLFCEVYNVTGEGNFEHQTSIIHLTESIADYARRKNLPAAGLNEKLQVMRGKLFEIRKNRIPPYKDDKVLTAWNGLMISALSRGGRALEESRLTAAAAKCADFLLTTMKGKQGLLRRYREGEVAIAAFHEDYAFLALGLLDLYEATFEPRWLLEAKRLTDEMVTLFWDAQAGGFFYTREDGEKLIARSKEYYDGAVPSGNSIAAMLLIRFARMTGDPAYEEKANKTIQSNSAGLLQYPSGFPELLMAYDFALGPSREVVIAGDFSSSEFQAFKQTVNGRFYPQQVVVARSTATDDKLDALIPMLKMLKVDVGKTTGYVCQNFSCQQPVFNVKDFERVLGE